MTTATQSDLPSRLRELAHLDGLLVELLAEPGRSDDERNGIAMCETCIACRRIDLNSGRAPCGNLRPRAAAFTEIGDYIDLLDHLRREPTLTIGERSGISDVMVSAQLRRAFMVDGPRELIAAVRENYDIWENAKRIAARASEKQESRQEAGDVQGGSGVHEKGIEWTFAQWIVGGLMLLGLALGAALADWFAGG